MLGSLVPINSHDQIWVEQNSLLELLHRCKPQGELVLHLEDLEDLREDVQELWDVHLKTHLFTLFGNFVDQVEE